MYHKQLVKHVETKLQAGNSNEEITKELINDGWSADDISEAFYYNNFPEKLGHFSFVRLLHTEVPFIITFFVALISIILISFILYNYDDNIDSYTINLPENNFQQDNKFSYGAQEALSNPDFFEGVKKQFIDNKANFVEANLSAMTIQVFKDGVLSFTVPIDTKGRRGSWWETPAGIYKIISKEEKHYSSMGHVWMPWSLNFQGNFYIHGLTYYPDGTFTSKDYTGGCIRLSTDNAKKLFDAVKVETPLLVFEDGFSPDNFKYDNNSLLLAPIYLAVDIGNNHVFASKDSIKEVPIASITKLVTALVAVEYINLDATTIVPKEAIVFTSKPRLKVGDQISVYQLLFPLLAESSNEAAETIALHYGRKSFIKRMNEKATSIGMLHSSFSDPSGASAENISTAEDIFLLAKYIYNNRSFIFNITSGKLKDNAYGDNGFSDLGNFNDFIDNKYFFGGKNGKTSAAIETNLSVFELPVGSTTRPVAIINLKSTNEKRDSEALLNYVLSQFR